MRVTAVDANPDCGPWTYAELLVIDGERRLTPSHVAYDRLIFRAAPRIQTSTVEIILKNGTDVQKYTASVLPHVPESLRIPIRLVK